MLGQKDDRCIHGRAAYTQEKEPAHGFQNPIHTLEQDAEQIKTMKRCSSEPAGRMRRGFNFHALYLTAPDARNLSALPTTDTELKLMAAPAIIGFSRSPSMG